MREDRPVRMARNKSPNGTGTVGQEKVGETIWIVAKKNEEQSLG